MLIISAVQFRPRFARCRADVMDNVRTCEPLIGTAAALGSHLLVFPELFATGYSFLSRDEACRVAEPFDGPTAVAMTGVAASLKAHVVWGFVEALDGRLFNSSSMAGPDGRVLTTYRKMNLWGNDFLWASPGRALPEVVETEIGRLATVVCRDARDKVPTNVPRTAARTVEPPMFDGRRVDLVALPVNWGRGGFPAVQWMDLAAENRCTVVVANRWGEESNGTFVQDFGQGGSAVVSPDWTVRTAGLRFGQDCVVTAAVESLR